MCVERCSARRSPNPPGSPSPISVARQVRAEARRQRVAELGDPPPHRLA